jgi:hypothetical protein
MRNDKRLLPGQGQDARYPQNIPSAERASVRKQIKPKSQSGQQDRPRSSRAKREQLTRNQQEAKLRGLAAINRVRKGQSKSLSASARTEGTTVKAIRKLLPGALTKKKSGGRIQVKSGDSYSVAVEIITASGPLVVQARGSRERDLAGAHRAAVFSVPNAFPLIEFQGKTVGGHELISDPNQLHTLASAGVLGHLDNLYVSPEASS